MVYVMNERLKHNPRCGWYEAYSRETNSIYSQTSLIRIPWSPQKSVRFWIVQIHYTPEYGKYNCLFQEIRVREENKISEIQIKYSLLSKNTFLNCVFLFILKDSLTYKRQDSLTFERHKAWISSTFVHIVHIVHIKGTINAKFTVEAATHLGRDVEENHITMVLRPRFHQAFSCRKKWNNKE